MTTFRRRVQPRRAKRGGEMNKRLRATDYWQRFVRLKGQFQGVAQLLASIASALKAWALSIFQLIRWRFKFAAIYAVSGACSWFAYALDL